MGTRLTRWALGLPLFWKIVLGNAVALGFGAIGAMHLVDRAVQASLPTPWLPVFLVLTVLVAVVLVNAGLVRLALRPLDLLEETAERVTQGDLAARVLPSALADAPTRRLAGVVNAMLEQVESSRRDERAGSRRLLALGERHMERVSRSLYDEVAQTLAALLVQLRLCADAASVPAGVTDEIRRLIDEVRRLARDLRPPELDELGLRAALQAHARAMTGGRNLSVTVGGDLPEDRLSPGVRLELFRMVEETIAYAVLSKASRVEIVFGATPESLVTDLRLGAVPSHSTEAAEAALLGLRARARQVGGQLEVGAPGDDGVHARVVMPWQEVHELVLDPLKLV